MSTIEIITPEYIIEQIELLTKNELLQLINNYGEQEYEHGSKNGSYEY